MFSAPLIAQDCLNNDLCSQYHVEVININYPSMLMKISHCNFINQKKMSFFPLLSIHLKNRSTPQQSSGKSDHSSEPFCTVCVILKMDDKMCVFLRIQCSNAKQVGKYTVKQISRTVTTLQYCCSKPIEQKSCGTLQLVGLNNFSVTGEYNSVHSE